MNRPVSDRKSKVMTAETHLPNTDSNLESTSSQNTSTAHLPTRTTNQTLRRLNRIRDHAHKQIQWIRARTVYEMQKECNEHRFVDGYEKTDLAEKEYQLCKEMIEDRSIGAILNEDRVWEHLVTDPGPLTEEELDSPFGDG